MKLTGITFAFVFATLLSACDQAPDMSTYQQDMKKSNPAGSGRFEVERVSVFRDKLAYDGRRGVYVITDTETGKQFVGVSGVGVSELGSHSNGKMVTTDER